MILMMMEVMTIMMIRSANENQVLGILILMLVLFISPAIIGLVRSGYSQ